MAGRSMQSELDALVHGTDDLPLQGLLQRAGIVLTTDSADLAAELGVRVSEGALSGIHVKSVLRGSAAERAGVSTGDELLAIDGWRLRRLEDARGWLRAGQGFALTLVHDQRLLTLAVPAPAPQRAGVKLKSADTAAPAALALRREWLGV